MYIHTINEDVRRQRNIIDRILLGWIFLSFVGFIVFIITSLGILAKSKESQGSPLIVNILVLVFFIFLYFLSKKGWYRLVAFILVGIILLLAGYVSFSWRADAPLALLLYALSVITAGIVLGTKSSFFVTGLSFAIMTGIAYLQSYHIIPYDKLWALEPTGLKDTITASVALLIIAIISFLSNFELEKALRRAWDSEAAVEKQRDELEVIVEQRTRQLKQVQVEKLAQLYRFSEFGKMASGLFHDLANPLALVSINLDRLNEKTKKIEQHEIKKLLDRSLLATKRLEGFVFAARKQMQNQETLQLFSLKDEILQVIQMLGYKAKKAHVSLTFQAEKDLLTFGNPIKFSQVMTNLITNAIDAYDANIKNMFGIRIALQKNNEDVRITVQDWGSGILTKNLPKIFDPLFTTKSFEKGTGMGLAICKDIIEKDFKGKILVKSKENEGTIFTILFPLKRTA